MSTYWLTGKRGYCLKLPNYEDEFVNDIPLPRQLPPTSGKCVDGKTMRPSIESGFSESIGITEKQKHF